MQKFLKPLFHLITQVLWVFWVGGFSFYLSVVVPIGGFVLGPDQQGLVTAEVTLIFNYGGILFGLGWLYVGLRGPIRSKLICFEAILLMSLSIFLTWLRPETIRVMNEESSSAFQGWTFYGIHRLYIWVSLFQWLASVVIHIWYTWLRLTAKKQSQN